MDQTPEKPDEEEGQTALVPKSFFKGPIKPGNEEKVRMLRVYEDEVEIKCVYEKEEEEPPAEEMAEGGTEPQDEMMM